MYIQVFTYTLVQLALPLLSVLYTFRITPRSVRGRLTIGTRASGMQTNRAFSRAQYRIECVACYCSEAEINLSETKTERIKTKICGAHLVRREDNNNNNKANKLHDAAQYESSETVNERLPPASLLNEYVSVLPCSSSFPHVSECIHFCLAELFVMPRSSES